MDYEECHKNGCGNRLFAKGGCRKHYDIERRENADLCSVNGCTAIAERKGLCNSHYRKELLLKAPRCSVKGCTNPVVSHHLCDKHRKRIERHSSIEQTRPNSWGSLTSHPLYETWRWHCKRNQYGIAPEWENDFHAFIAVIGDKPKNHTLRKKIIEKSMSPDNWYWKEKILKNTNAKYAKEWRKRNPRKSKNSDLKKVHGITIDEYEEMFKNQNGKCAICGKNESSTNPDGSIRYLAVDHCHNSKKIRGLLCTMCNTAIGKLNDDINLLRSAIRYLEANNA